MPVTTAPNVASRGLMSNARATRASDRSQNRSSARTEAIEHVADSSNQTLLYSSRRYGREFSSRISHCSESSTTLHTSKRRIVRVRPCIQPRTVISSPHHYSVIGYTQIFERLNDLTTVVVQFHERVQVVSAARRFFAPERRRIVRNVNHFEIQIHEEGL